MAGVPSSGWLERFQLDLDGQGLLDSMSIGLAGCWFGLNEPGVTAGMQMAARLEQSFRTSPDVAACKLKYPEPGKLRFTVRNNLETRQRPYAVSGSLANRPLAARACPAYSTTCSADRPQMTPDVTWAFAEEPLPGSSPLARLAARAACRRS